jgi:hypothetical protein
MRRVGEARHGAVEAEIRGEMAAALGDGARRVEAALAALREAEPGDQRERLLTRAADAVWGFLIQRELRGLRDDEQVIAHHRIPREVLNRAGAMNTAKAQ